MNNARGEASILINGQAYKLCLTLGALAKIESAFALESIGQIDAKFQSLSAKDLILLLAILLDGGQNPLSVQAIESAKINAKEVAEAVKSCFDLGFYENV